MTELFDQRFPADLGRMADLRGVLRHRLDDAGVPEIASERLILVVDEVVSNSIEHGTAYRHSDEPIRVQVGRVATGLLLQVEDADVPTDLVLDLARVVGGEADAAPSAMAERGRGMFLITLFLEDLEIALAKGGGMRLRGRLVCQP